VKKAEVSLEKARARVEFDDAKISPNKLVAAIDQLGFRAKLLGVGRAPERPAGSPASPLPRHRGKKAQAWVGGFWRRSR